MARIAPVVPEETDLLCEGCGYTLNGLPLEGNCPECGKPIQESLGEHRRPSAWEDPEDHRPAFVRFLATSALCMFRPATFFSNITVRRDDDRALLFAVIHWALASLVVGVAAALHSYRYSSRAGLQPRLSTAVWAAVIALMVWVLTWGINRLAAWLSFKEATWRGLRLPLSSVRRALYYHAAHYQLPALLVLGIVLGMHVLSASGVIVYGSLRAETNYIYSLCGAVILCAGYLFQTYWTAMRKIMFANR